MCTLPIIAILVAFEATVALMASEPKFDPRIAISKLNYSGVDVHVASNSQMASEAMTASKQLHWPHNSNLTSDLKSASSNTLVSLCMLPLTAILMTSEAMAASKQPRI